MCCPSEGDAPRHALADEMVPWVEVLAATAGMFNLKLHVSYALDMTGEAREAHLVSKLLIWKSELPSDQTFGKHDSHSRMELISPELNTPLPDPSEHPFRCHANASAIGGSRFYSHPGILLNDFHDAIQLDLALGGLKLGDLVAAPPPQPGHQALSSSRIWLAPCRSGVFGSMAASFGRQSSSPGVRRGALSMPLHVMSITLRCGQAVGLSSASTRRTKGEESTWRRLEALQVTRLPEFGTAVSMALVLR
ncbi:hypothetical protein AXG93_3005s1140 [Marchantia polymorpha subsp. ruderalis]|uniref:Uncharacterized protein n=1 Tax=Marchantia polymorpha subsp. ruderalis TaxID=1480154 RepID=A0A176WLD6_MARPO|nr:hypothetical protein AXG93_3005s1140 [Marchantia polymorpha subsp. ruderalis]